MIHLIAILLGALVIALIFGFFYVIHTVLAHFGLDTEEILLYVFGLAVAGSVAWVLGTVALETLEWLGII